MNVICGPRENFFDVEKARQGSMPCVCPVYCDPQIQNRNGGEMVYRAQRFQGKEEYDVPPEMQMQKQQNSSSAPNMRNLFEFKLSNHFIIEFIATLLICYSDMWLVGKGAADQSFSTVPAMDAGLFLFRQFIPSLAIAACTLVLKDMEYLFPDTSTMTTIVLWAGGAYTNVNGVTDYTDMLVRIIGHFVGWLFVLNTYVMPHDKDMFASSHDIGVEWTFYFNEAIAVAIESLAVAYVTIPLLKPYSPEVSRGFRSKTEADPPKNHDVMHAAIALGLVHYVLQVCFRADMSFFTYAFHVYFSTLMKPWLLIAQFAGLGVACIYSSVFFPDTHVYHKALLTRGV